MGEHPIKGMFHVLPPKIRYSLTSDVKVLLTFLELWFPLSVLDLTQLTLKTADFGSEKLNVVGVEYRIYEFNCHWYVVCSK